MSEYSRGDYFDLDERSADYEKALHDKLCGTYSEGWAMFRRAVASIITHAAIATQNTLTLCDTIEGTSKSRAEAAFVMEMNYSISILGPCLSGVILTAMSVESFLRLGFLISIDRTRTVKARKHGVDATMLDQLNKFDDCAIAGKIDQLSTSLKCQLLKKTDPVRTGVATLVRYRNECAHDTPIVTLGVGSFSKPNSHKKQTDSVNKHIGQYERLGLSMRPVRLTHVVTAVDAHDKLVEFFFSQPDNSGWKEDVLAVSGGWWGGGLISKALGEPLSWASVERLAGEWESGPEAFISGISLRESREFGQTMRRRSRVKLT